MSTRPPKQPNQLGFGETFGHQVSFQSVEGSGRLRRRAFVTVSEPDGIRRQETYTAVTRPEECRRIAQWFLDMAKWMEAERA